MIKVRIPDDKLTHFLFHQRKFIMTARKKWKGKEDTILKEIILGQEKPYKWDIISFMLKKKGINKSSK